MFQQQKKKNFFLILFFTKIIVLNTIFFLSIPCLFLSSIFKFKLFKVKVSCCLKCYLIVIIMFMFIANKHLLFLLILTFAFGNSLSRWPNIFSLWWFLCSFIFRSICSLFLFFRNSRSFYRFLVTLRFFS